MKPMRADDDPIEYWGRKVFHAIFRVKLHQRDMYSREEISTMGLPTRGDRELDEDTMAALVHVQITINEMLMRFNEGQRVYIVNPADTELIYKICINYISAWLDHERTELNRRPVPAEDLMSLDRFAASLYPHAKPYMEVKTGSNLADRLRGQSIEAYRVGPKKKLARRELPDDHTSQAEELAKTLMRAGTIGRFDHGV